MIQNEAPSHHGYSGALRIQKEAIRTDGEGFEKGSGDMFGL